MNEKKKKRYRKKKGRKISFEFGGKDTKLIAGAWNVEAEINLDPNLLILSVR